MWKTTHTARWLPLLGGTDLTWAGLAETVLINGAISLLAIFVGLLLSRRIGLELPFIREWVTGEKSLTGAERRATIRLILWGAPAVGVGLSAAIITADLGFSAIALGISWPQAAAQYAEGIRSGAGASLWAALLAMFYGGIFEEISTRFFFITLFAWLISLVVSRIRREPLRGYAGALAAAVVLAAVIFGVGHLATVAQMGELTTLAVVRTIMLNAVPGIVFGLLYWKRGLESAIVTHMWSDIGLHVLTPLVFAALA